MTVDRVAMLKQILAQDANDTFARYGLALEYANSGQVDAAMAEFRKLFEVNPDYVPGYQMAAQTLLAAGRTDEGRGILEEGIARAKKSGNGKAQSEMENMLSELG